MRNNFWNFCRRKMNRLFQIEWLKLRHYRTFWVLMVLYFLSLLVVTTGGMALLYWIERQGGTIEGISPTIIPLYDFPDVWHNLTYIASFLKIFLSFIVIISITNEYSYRTMQQNVIDGLSPREFLLSKVLFIGILSLANTLFIGIVGLVMGLIFSSVHDLQSILTYAEFLPVHLLEVFTFLLFALLVGILLRKAGFAIVFTGIYTLIIEPILTVSLPESWEPVYQWFPIRALNNLVHIPFPKYIFREVQDFVSPKELMIVVVWAVALYYANYLVLSRRDVKG